MKIMSRLGRSKYIDWILNVCALGMTFFLGLTVYWFFEDDNIIVANNGNYSIDKNVYETGEVLNIHLRICKNKDLEEHVVGTLIDGVIFSIPDKYSNFEVGCYDTYITSVHIPETLPEGTFHYEEKVTYKINPIKEKTYVFKTPKFEVIKGEQL